MSWHAPSLELIGCVHVGKEKACHGKCCRCGWENFHVKYPVFQVVITPNECFWGCASLHSFLLACDNACLHGSRLCLTMFSAQLAVSAGVLHCSGSTWPQLRWEVRVFYVFYSVLLQIWVKDKKKKKSNTCTFYDSNAVWHTLALNEKWLPGDSSGHNCAKKSCFKFHFMQQQTHCPKSRSCHVSPISAVSHCTT